MKSLKEEKEMTARIRKRSKKGIELLKKQSKHRLSAKEREEFTRKVQESLACQRDEEIGLL